MKTNLYIVRWLTVATLFTFNLQPATVFAQGTAFTYQGRLQNNGSPASGTYNLTFSLFNTNASGVPIAGPVTNNAVSVTNGLFTVLIDFGPGAYTGATNWLEIAVETNGVNTFTTLAPRQQLTPVPYAIYAEGAGGLIGTLSASQLTSLGNTSGGSGNFFVGPSGNSTTSGINNTAIGAGALFSNTSGSGNTANGYGALVGNTSGIFNTANGDQALSGNTSGSGNTANGLSALYFNTSGSYNIALGYQAGLNITTGSSNIDIGNAGLSTDTNIIRIGSGQTGAYIAGVIHGNGAGLTGVPGVITWQTASGTVQAQPNNGYIATNASQVTVTLPTSPNVGDTVRVSGPAAGGWKIAQNSGQSVLGGDAILSLTATIWEPQSVTNAWKGVASSADGTKLIAYASPPNVPGSRAQIYTSADSGVTWTPRDSVRDWMGVASSADGSKLVACVHSGQIYTSTDSGVTWTAQNSGSLGWSSVACSSDGTKLVAADELGSGNGGQIYTSTDSGVTWTARGINTNWISVASSADGSKLVACVSGGQIYTSTDSGVTWTAQNSGNVSWASVASSADGTKLVAADDEVGSGNGGQIYTSTDSGVTWTARGINTNWTSVASSADGSKLVACVSIGQIYTSTDSGVTWTPRDNNREWTGVVSSADGSKLVACVFLGQIYTSAPVLSPCTTTTIGTGGYLAGVQGTAIELQYVGNNQFFPLSHEGTILGY